MKNLSSMLLTVGAIITIAGSFMKIMHYPYAALVLLIGLTFGAIGFSTLAFKKSKTA